MSDTKAASLLKRGSFYLLLAALLVGTLWRGGYYLHSVSWTGVGSQLPSLVFIALLLLAGAWEISVDVASRQRDVMASPAGIMLLVFLLFSAAGIVWSISPSDTIRQVLLLTGYVLVLFTVRGQLLREGRRIQSLATSWLVYVAAFASAWAIISYLFRISPFAYVKDDLMRASSTFEYSNALSCFCLMALPLAFAIMEKEKPEDRPLNVAGGAIIAAAALITFSRLGLVLFAALAVFFVVLYWRRGFVLSVLVSLGLGVAAAVLAMITQEAGYPIIGLVAVILVMVASYLMQMLIEKVENKRLLTAGAIAAVAAGLLLALISLSFSGQVQDIIANRFGTEMNYESLLGHRLDVYRGALDAIQAKPVGGSGLGTFADFYQNYTITTDPTIFAHNVVIQMASDTGLIGVILFSVFLVYSVVLALRKFFGRSSPLMRSLAASLAVFVLYSMFDWEWYIPVLTAWFMVIVALMEFGDSFPEPEAVAAATSNPKTRSKSPAGAKKRPGSRKKARGRKGRKA